MSNKGYIVPLETPKYCNKCEYGHCIYSYPFWANGSICRFDGEFNAPNTQGYICQIDKINNNRHIVMRTEFDKDLEKPNWCPLKEVLGNE